MAAPFSGKGKSTRSNDIALSSSATEKPGWSGSYSPHASRTTESTRLDERGYRPDAIEAKLAHADTNNVRRTYNHATYLDERKVMIREWEDMLDKWVAGSN
jgi:integrase